VQELVSRGVKITAYDPKATETAKAILGDSITYSDGAVAAAKDADVLTILTEWKDFAKVPLSDLKMRRKHIMDLRHIIDGNSARQNGFYYEGIGKK
jgi:UDPglucose 6-dehydrogenase